MGIVGFWLVLVRIFTRLHNSREEMVELISFTKIHQLLSLAVRIAVLAILLCVLYCSVSMGMARML